MVTRRPEKKNPSLSGDLQLSGEANFDADN